MGSNQWLLRSPVAELLGRKGIALLFLLTLPAFAQPDSVRQAIARKDFRTAEKLARQDVAKNPASREARSTLAWVTLWYGRYSEARALFATLVRENSKDASARLGLAQAEYWSGDFGAARRDFEELLRLDPRNVEARRALDEMAPRYEAGVDAINDDQPYRSVTTFFRARAIPSDKEWNFGAAVTSFRDNTNALSAGGGVRFRNVHLSARAFRFPDETTRILPRIEVRTATLSLIADQHELLRSAPALRTHPYATSVALRWARERESRSQFAVRAERVRYFDDNDGTAADAYALFPIRAFSVGGSVAYRDTSESRFNGIQYDPYYTPQNMREARLIAARSWKTPHATIGVHIDGGAGRDELFGVSRTFHPWRAAANASVPFANNLTLNIRGEHNVTIYYSANEFSASVAGRF